MLLLYLVLALALTFLEAFFVYKAAANRKRANLIAGTPLTHVGALAAGRAKVQGRAVAFSEPLAAPLSGRSCVYFRFKVEEKRTHARGPHGGGGSYWKTVIDDVQSVACGVDDGTGIAGVNLAEAEVVLGPGTQTRSGFWNDAPPELERVLRECYGRSSQGLIFNKGMRYTETRIEEGGPSSGCWGRCMVRRAGTGNSARETGRALSAIRTSGRWRPRTGGAHSCGSSWPCWSRWSRVWCLCCWSGNCVG
jgi:hypothetical protein